MQNQEIMSSKMKPIYSFRDGNMDMGSIDPEFIYVYIYTHTPIYIIQYIIYMCVYDIQ